MQPPHVYLVVMVQPYASAVVRVCFDVTVLQMIWRHAESQRHAPQSACIFHLRRRPLLADSSINLRLLHRTARARRHAHHPYTSSILPSIQYTSLHYPFRPSLTAAQ